MSDCVPMTSLVDLIDLPEIISSALNCSALMNLLTFLFSLDFFSPDSIGISIIVVGINIESKSYFSGGGDGGPLNTFVGCGMAYSFSIKRIVSFL